MSRGWRWPAGLATLLSAGSCAEPAPPRALPAVPIAAPAPSPTAVPILRLEGERTQGALLRGTVPAGTVRVMLDTRPVPVAADGGFVIGLDRDAPSLARLTAMLADGRTVSEAIAVSPRGWRLSRLSTLPKVPMPSADFARRRPIELAAIAAARAAPVVADGWRQPFAWPATGRISTLFGSQRIYANGEAGSYHTGIDIARPTGTPVLAPADGVVTLVSAGPYTLEGNLVLVAHGGGLESAFMHLSSVAVAPGERVRRGQPIGAIGATGRATGPHLHWGLRWQDARIDPLLVAGAMPTGAL